MRKRLLALALALVLVLSLVPMAVFAEDAENCVTGLSATIPSEITTVAAQQFIVSVTAIGTAGTGFTVSSSDATVLTAAADGDTVTLTPVKNGTATVTVTANGTDASGETVKVEQEVTVNVPVESVTISGDDTYLKIGDTMQLSATVAPLADTVTWSSNDEDVATVDENGLVTPVAAGTVTITATAGEESDEVTIVVYKAIESVAVDPGTATLVMGNKADLTATLTPDDATESQSTSGIVWTTSDVKVADVTNGVVTPVKPGTATITATFTDMAGKVESNTCEVTVVPAVAKVDDTYYGTLSDAVDAIASATEKKITLQADVAAINFNNTELTINLNGHKLTGNATDASNVTVENYIFVGYEVPETPETPVFEDVAAPLLLAEGTYKNDVSKYVCDGYDATEATENSGIKNVIANNEDTEYNIVLEVTPDDADRDTSTDVVDVFADDYITVTVKVTGSRYVSADIKLTWDTSLFVDETMSWDVMPGWEADDEDNTTSWRFVKAHDDDGYYQDGEVIGSFTFRALYIDEAIVKGQVAGKSSTCTFTVKSGSGTETAKVIPSWRMAKLDSTTTPLTTAQLEDDVAHIVLMDAMTGSVEEKTGLTYKADPQNLLNPSFNGAKSYKALVGGVEPDNSGVSYVVMPKTEYDAAVAADANYVPTYGSSTVPQAINAGDYVVCYKISAPGYVSVTGVKNINIAKQAVDLTWVMPTYKGTPDGDKAFSNGTGDVNALAPYDTVGFNAPTASFTLLGNSTDSAVVQFTSYNGDTADHALKDVGTYVFTAQDNENYSFNNPTYTVKIQGQQLTGWTLRATNSEDETPTTGVIWRDGTDYAIGYLDVANDANLAKDAEDVNLVVKYEYSTGAYDTTTGDEIWTVITDTDSYKTSNLGKYKLRMTVTADNFEKEVQVVNFEIKNPIFVVETTEYVAGYSLILVYTNETGVSFKYDQTMMYDASGFGYKYNNNKYGNGSVNYAFVYSTVIKGVPDTSLVYASNAPALQFTLDSKYVNVVTENSTANNGNVYVNDVNNKTEAKVDLDDITAVQSIYNVNAGNMLDMEVVLRADVNRDKMVDTIGDVNQVLAYYLNPPTNP